MKPCTLLLGLCAVATGCTQLPPPDEGADTSESAATAPIGTETKAKPSTEDLSAVDDLQETDFLIANGGVLYEGVLVAHRAHVFVTPASGPDPEGEEGYFLLPKQVGRLLWGRRMDKNWVDTVISPRWKPAGDAPATISREYELLATRSGSRATSKIDSLRFTDLTDTSAPKNQDVEPTKPSAEATRFRAWTTKTLTSEDGKETYRILVGPAKGTSEKHTFVVVHVKGQEDQQLDLGLPLTVIRHTATLGLRTFKIVGKQAGSDADAAFEVKFTRGASGEISAVSKYISQWGVTMPLPSFH